LEDFFLEEEEEVGGETLEVGEASLTRGRKASGVKSIKGAFGRQI
jgi:hypothetical protein